MPDAIRPYLYLMRLDRPIGTWLLLLPGWWAILLAGGLGAWPTLTLFAIGAIVMRGAGCVVNDLWDRDLDSKVERTSTRPIPNGDVTPKQAMIFLGGLLFLGFIILLQFNLTTIILGVVSLAFIVAYPLMKRITWWPQAFLGLTFNFGALMGWAAITGGLGWQAWVLYIASFFWTLGYDTIYALQDRRDDALIGIKSSARWLSEKWDGNIKMPLYAFYAVHYLYFAVVLLWGSNISFFGVVFLTLPLLHLIWQVKTLDTDSPQNALKRFQSNRDYGLLMCVVITLLYHM